MKNKNRTKLKNLNDMTITERFLNYTQFDTQSAEDSATVPSTPKQLVFAKYLKEGGTINGFLAYYVNELDKAFHEREACKEMVMKSMKTEDPALARDIFLKFNERLAEKGIKPLTLTRRQKEYLGITED